MCFTAIQGTNNRHNFMFRERDIFNIAIILYSNGGNVLLLLIGVHWSAKNVLNKVIFSYIFVTNVPLHKRGMFFL